ncbi:polysaccharide biosynthesis tyrosine autokinase [bacterium]|nr:polysaccharide biosynthesis tyrosine autokinase [bacterium]
MNQISQNSYNRMDEEEEINIQEIFRIVFQGKWIIILSFILVVLVTGWYTFTTDPVYESSTLVLIENSGAAATGMFDLMSPFGSNQMQVNNELEIVKSRTLAIKTLNALKRDYAQDSLLVLGGTQADKEKTNPIQALKQWVLLLGSQADTSEYIPSEAEEMRDWATSLQQNISISTIRETQAIRITYQSKSAVEAALVVNTMIHEYYNLDLDRSRGAMGEVKDFLSSQLVKIEKSLRESEDSLQAYQQREGVVNLDVASQELLTTLSDFESVYYTAVAEKQVILKQLDYLKEQLSAKEKELLNSVIQTSNPLILNLQYQIALIEADIVKAESQGFNENSEQYKEYANKVIIYKKRLNAETQKLLNYGYIPGPDDPMGVNQSLLKDIVRLQTEQISTDAKVLEYDRLVKFYNGELEKLPLKIISFARLERERQVNEKLYLLMKQRFEESRITEASQIGSVYVIDPAIPGKYPIKPKKKMNVLLGGFLGLGLGIGIIFIREFLDNTIKSKEDVQKAGFSVLAMVPSMDTDSLRKKAAQKTGDEFVSNFQSRLIVNLDSKSPVSESYRSLRTNIELSRIDDKIKSIVVTSSGPGEGKSTTIANLALAYAQMDYKTVLIDADLRKPVIHKLFKINRVPGLVDAVMGRANMDEIIYETDIKNLYIIPSGNIPPNPSETLGSKKMKEVYKEIQNQFDRIFFDAPPIIAVTDSTVVGTYTDAMLFVVNSGHTYKELLQHSKSLIEQTYTDAMLFVVNNVNPNNMTGSYYYYHKYYHYKY